MEEAERVRPPADARDEHVRQPAELAPHLAPDDRLEVAHQHRVRVRPGGGPDAVVGRPDVGDPVPDRLVHRVLERAASRPDGDHAPPEELHPEDVERLAHGVLLAHVDLALEAEERRDGRRGDAVLAGARLRDDPRLAHALGEEPLAQRVVDLVGAGVTEVLALEVDARAAGMLGEPLGERQGRRAPHVLPRELGDPLPEGRVAPRLAVRRLQLEERRHQRLGHVAAAEGAEVPRAVGQARPLGDLTHGHPRRRPRPRPAPPGRSARP